MHATIMPQGKQGDLCRQLTKFAVEKDGVVSFPPIKFPCLRIALDANGNKFVITWSHFYHTIKLGPDKGNPAVSEHPGKFKLRHVDNRRPLMYERSNGRKMTDSRGRPMYDFIGMASEWGTEAVYDKGRYTWSYGPNHPVIEETIWEEEYETLEALHDALGLRFDPGLAAECVELFMGHELYQTYDTTCGAAA